MSKMHIQHIYAEKLREMQTSSEIKILWIEF